LNGKEKPCPRQQPKHAKEYKQQHQTQFPANRLLLTIQHTLTAAL
jgi:hypothetical protein